MSKQFRENVEIISSASGQSWLKLVNLPSGTAQTTYNGLLWLDASGNVIKINAATIATVTVWPTAPSAPVSGQQWLDTSLTPSELKVYNGAAWELAGDEVQHYANFAAFPATGDEDVLYVDDAADIIYVWDSTTSAYVNASWTGAGLFTITDGTTSQSIGVGNTLSFLDTNLIKAEVSATDTLTISIDTTGATIWQTPSFDWTNVVWTTPLSQNIYTDDGVLDSNRVVDMNWNFLRFQDNAVPTKYIELEVDNVPTIKFNTLTDSARIFFDENNSELQLDYPTWAVLTNWAVIVLNSSSDIQLNATADLLLDSWNWSYSLVTSPTTAPVLTGMEVLMRESTTGILYKKDVSTFDNIYTANWTLAADRTVTMSSTEWITFVWDIAWEWEVWLYANFDLRLQWWVEAGHVYTNPTEWWTATVGTKWSDFMVYSNDKISVIAETAIVLDSQSSDYRMITAPTTATTQIQSLVRDTSTWRLYLKDLATLSTARYANTWTPTANVETVHTHALSAGEDIQIQVRDATTKEIVDVEIRIISATTFGVTSTTADPLRVIAL